MRISSAVIGSSMVFLLKLCLGLCFAAAQPACRMSHDSGSVVPRTVDHYLSDPVLGRKWAVMVDCRHPGWPPRAVEVPLGLLGTRAEMRPATDWPRAPRSRAATPAVESGARVELWSEGAASIHLSGVALDSASVGQEIRVRAGVNGKALRGVVRGPRSVELDFNR
ncbi:MAG TPA: flagella basal body P-ring formation protein FlgA, partial [Silvibacterium sp.]|nr:flagella basal body P-ring formation protein FlgA [Silvibacterium sp.]